MGQKTHCLRAGIQRAACQHLDAVSHGRDRRGWVTSSKPVQGCLSLLTEDGLPCPKDLFIVPLLNTAVLKMWNLEGTFLNYNSHYWLSRTDPINAQLLHDAILVLGEVLDIETRTLYMIDRNFLAFSKILSWVRTLLSWQGGLELVILLPHLLRELGLQAWSTMSGYAVNLTLTVSSIISSSHFTVRCPLGTGQAS